MSSIRFTSFAAALVLSAALLLAAPAEEKKAAPKGKTTQKAGAKKAGDAAKGQEVFAANCKACHYADKADKRIGPGLAGLYKKEKLENGKPVNDGTVRAIIVDGAGTMMAFGDRLEKKEIDDVIAYLKTL